MLVRAVPAHADVLAALHATSFRAPWSASEFATLLGQPGVAAWIWDSAAPAGFIPAGFIMMRAAADEAEILTLAVAPAQRRKGIAARLLTVCCETLQAGGATRMFLEVAADNVAASTLYTAHGFEACGRRPDYYGAGAANGPVDAVVMMKRLMK
jgi:ribosomal-protein-alanine N-acetyltransferase